MPENREDPKQQSCTGVLLVSKALIYVFAYAQQNINKWEATNWETNQDTGLRAFNKSEPLILKLAKAEMRFVVAYIVAHSVATQGRPAVACA